MFNLFIKKKREKSVELERIANSLDKIHALLSEKRTDMEKRIYDSVLKKLRHEMETKAAMTKEAECSGCEKNKREVKTVHKQEIANKPDNKPSDYFENAVLKALISRGVEIRKSGKTIDCHDSFAHLYQYMGDRFNDVAKFMKKLKTSISGGKRIRLCVKNWTDREISTSCQLALKLYEAGFLDMYKYFKSPSFVMNFRVARVPKVINFLTGTWLECYVSGVIERNLRMGGVEYIVEKNPLVTLPNGKQFEMDLLFKINDDLHWFEIKSGEYKSYLEKYTSIGRLLGIKPENRYLILADETQKNCDNLSKIYDINVLNLEMLKDKIAGIARNLKYDLKQAVS